ncbi:hypothetical protein IGI04_036319 [Brassica rapa subsp. trilocularis]|uniref:Uncharacterized protein n=1 Tax=Brassica rapa subsp. trilocularis TaxID=1813537 RepID=A0ABQ7LE80_BRACM|nr:hypothetical protein IGI04_036319 [Brassica rapa subsp. trilocularis]
MLTMTGRNSPEVQGCSVIPKVMHGAHNSMGLAVAKMAYHVNYLGRTGVPRACVAKACASRASGLVSTSRDRIPRGPVLPRPSSNMYRGGGTVAYDTIPRFSSRKSTAWKLLQTQFTCFSFATYSPSYVWMILLAARLLPK